MLDTLYTRVGNIYRNLKDSALHLSILCQPSLITIDHFRTTRASTNGERKYCLIIFWIHLPHISDSKSKELNRTPLLGPLDNKD